ncbi:MAG: hypoxanthine phosphoribosyltransferase [Bacteroidetes bacterium]|nr:hypoxanthine phosphoribosyltransferase [Bacteroidota bacterium]
MTNNIEIADKQFEIYINADVIAKRVKEIASALNHDFSGKTPVFISVLNGAFMFTSDLLKHVEGACEVHFVKLSSYSGTGSTGEVKQLVGLNTDLSNRDVIILEDIVDTGLTMKMLIGQISTMHPSSISVCTLLLKPDALVEDIKVNYACFEIPEKFVVGYGLDLDGIGRNLPHIYQII